MNVINEGFKEAIEKIANSGDQTLIFHNILHVSRLLQHFIKTKNTENAALCADLLQKLTEALET